MTELAIIDILAPAFSGTGLAIVLLVLYRVTELERDLKDHRSDLKTLSADFAEHDKMLALVKAKLERMET